MEESKKTFNIKVVLYADELKAVYLLCFGVEFVGIVIVTQPYQCS